MSLSSLFCFVCAAIDRIVTVVSYGSVSVWKEQDSRKIFEPKREEVAEDSKNTYLCSEEAHNLCCSSSILRVVRSEMMRLAGYVVDMGETMHIQGVSRL